MARTRRRGYGLKSEEQRDSKYGKRGNARGKAGAKSKKEKAK